MATLLRSGRSTIDVAPKIARTRQAGDLGKEVARSAPLGWRPGLHQAEQRPITTVAGKQRYKGRL